MRNVRDLDESIRVAADRGLRAGAADEGSILLVANFDSAVGFAWWLIERYWVAIAQAHGGRRRVLLAYPSISQIPEEIEKAPIECFELDAGDRSPDGFARLVDFVRMNQVTSIYWTDGRLIDSHYDALRRAGVLNIVVHSHRAALPTHTGGIRGVTKRLLHRWGGYSADHYVAVSEFVQNTIERNAKVPPKKTFHIGSGVDLARLDDHSASNLTLPSADVRIAMMGRIDPGKGTGFAIEVMKRLKELEVAATPESPMPKIRLVHLGSGTMYEETKRRIQAEGLDEYFYLLGYQKNIGGILRKCQIGFHPSDREVGYSLAILEMLSQRLPVVVPDNESVSGSIRGARCWESYPELNVEGAVRAVLSLALDRGKRLGYGANGRSLVEREFDLRRSLEDFDERVVPLFC